MDSFEFNKIAGAVLFAALVAFGLGIVSDIIFEGHEAEAPGYVIEVAETGGAETGGEEAAEEPIAALMAGADAGAGEAVAKKCVSCHTFEKGGANKVGPALWNVVNRPAAAAEGFKYSDALKAFAEGGTVWDYERLNGFLAAPKKYVSGTSMSFAGVKKPADRADIIAYLRTLSDDPAPLPEATAAETAPAEAETAEAPAEKAMDAPMAETEAAPTEDAPKDETAMAAAPAAETPAAEAPAAEAPAADGPAAETAMTAPAQSESAVPAEDKPDMAAPAQSESAADSPVLAMVGDMSVEDGEKVAKKCTACHSFDEGGKNKVGPPLWGIMNRTAGLAEKFKYSDAMKAFGANGGAWDYVTLDAYLADPKGKIPKTKMSFSGLKKEKDRAAILAYLRTLAAEPVPLP